MTSARTDALSYSGWHENLVHSLDYLIVTSWGEILTHHYRGIEGLIACLCEHLRWLERSGRDRGFSLSHCCEPRYGNTIERRFTELFDAVIDWYFDSSQIDGSRYVLRAGDQYYALIRSGDQISQEFNGSFASLLDHLGQASEVFTDTCFDEQALDDLALSQIFSANRKGVVQFFYLIKERIAKVYVLDEHGALFVDQVSFFSEASLLDHFAQFFESVEFRQRSSLYSDTLGHALPSELTFAANLQENSRQPVARALEFFQLVLEKGNYRLAVKNFKRTHRTRAFIDIKVIGEQINDQTEFIVYVNEQEFSVREFGRQLFEKVTDHILARRTSGEPYPIHITDIDLSWLANMRKSDAPCHTIQYLQYKKRIEHKLNTEVAKRALQAVRRLAEDSGGIYLAAGENVDLPPGFAEDVYRILGNGGGFTFDLSPAVEQGLSGTRSLLVQLTLENGSASASIPVHIPSSLPPSPNVTTVVEKKQVPTPAGVLVKPDNLFLWIAVGLLAMVVIVMLFVLVFLLRRNTPAGTTIEQTAEPKSEESEGNREPEITVAYLEPLDDVGTAYTINCATYRIGRHSSNDLPVPDSSVSRQHAEIRRRGGRFSITDLDSMNGVFVNNKPRKHADLSDKDTIELGDVAFRFAFQTTRDLATDSTVIMTEAPTEFDFDISLDDDDEDEEKIA